MRILSSLPLSNLLAIAPVSRRFYRLASDSQLWKLLYYRRFVLPRAMRIPGFREGPAYGATPDGGRGHKLHYTGRRALWADGKRGGLVGEQTSPGKARDEGELVDWKRQYKIRHNWSRGRCAVEELKMGRGVEVRDDARDAKMLVKVVEGIAVTADAVSGLRAWDLRTRKLLAEVGLSETGDAATPTCIAIDDHALGDSHLDVAVGFFDGGFGIWRFDFSSNKLARRYRHEKSSNGELVGIAYSYPYILTATVSVLASLYTFDGPPGQPPTAKAAHSHRQPRDNPGRGKPPLLCPYLLTSLQSHTSRPPLALSIRKLASSAIASIAYTFSTRKGWSIGIQNLHIQAAPATGASSAPEVTSTRLAYTGPLTGGRLSGGSPSSPVLPASETHLEPPSNENTPDRLDPGPTSLCYTHPYLLATLPDNTLVLYLCTSNASTLTVSPGIRLWGHTSGISDAEITARGKAVSVSSRGDEMRVWELEGRPAALHGRSVEIRPNKEGGGEEVGGGGPEWDERRNWVGFDDEMVIVLKESRGGGESLMVYDFT